VYGGRAGKPTEGVCCCFASSLCLFTSPLCFGISLRSTSFACLSMGSMGASFLAAGWSRVSIGFSFFVGWRVRVLCEIHQARFGSRETKEEMEIAEGDTRTTTTYKVVGWKMRERMGVYSELSSQVWACLPEAQGSTAPPSANPLQLHERVD